MATKTMRINTGPEVSAGLDMATTGRPNNESTPSRPARDRALGMRVLPDVVAKTVLDETVHVGMKRKHRCSFGTPRAVRSYTELFDRQDHENQLSSSSIADDKISPGLARLRMTPGVLREKRQRLIDQHDEIRQKGDQLKSGGGISLWPEMHQMRLTRSEVLWLIVQAVGLCVLTLLLLNKLHGETFWKLQDFTQQIHKFTNTHHISETMTQKHFENEIKGWHKEFLRLTDNIQGHFDISKMSTEYQLYILTYFLGLAVLVYYLLDNMLSMNKLTPSRIKKWTCLLAVIGSWTGMMMYGLYLAYELELQAIRCVQKFASSLAFLVISPLNLDQFQAVLLYWRSRFLDHASHGVLKAFGLLCIRDLVYYLQYYSVPIVTVIVSPVVKLCYACWNVYSQGEYFKAS